MIDKSNKNGYLMYTALKLKKGEIKESEIPENYRHRIIELSSTMTLSELENIVNNNEQCDESIILPILNTDAIKKKKGKKNLENLKDYRDWIKYNKNGKKN